MNSKFFYIFILFFFLFHCSFHSIAFHSIPLVPFFFFCGCNFSFSKISRAFSPEIYFVVDFEKKRKNSVHSLPGGRGAVAGGGRERSFVLLKLVASSP